MLLPILRLLLIYAILILAVIGVFNRDKLSRLVFGDSPPEAVDITDPAEEAPAPPPAPNTEARAADRTPDISEPAPVAAPVTEMPVVPAEATPAPEAPAEVVQEKAEDRPIYPPATLETPVATEAPPALETPTPVPTPPAPTPAATDAQDAPVFPPAEPANAPVFPPADALEAPQARDDGPAQYPETPTATPPKPAGSTDPAVAEAIQSARSAYWQGDRTGAGQQLAALAEAHPENADIFGELGNYYFMEQDYPAAAEAFFKAAELLIAEGRVGQAMSLVAVLQPIDADKAAALAQRLEDR